MSLITRCPACETLFKVVPDQLRISDGWVRCGQCDEIFDASLHLLQAQPQATMPAVPPAEPAVNCDVPDVPDVPDVMPQAVEQPLAIEPEAGQQGSTDESPVTLEPVWPDAAQTVAAEELDTARLLPQPTPPEPSMAALPDLVAAVDLNDKDLEPNDLEPARPTELSDVSFLRDKSIRSFWDQWLVRATLRLLSLALVLALAGQIAFHERDRIAAMQPELKPWLLAICESLNCSLSPLRRIESIVIDSSSFTRIQGDSYRLNFTLINTATTALAVPAIELTLTDSLDQPVVRRVWLASELGAKSDTLAAGVEWPATLAFAVKAGEGPSRVAGYRLLAFYP